MRTISIIGRYFFTLATSLYIAEYAYVFGHAPPVSVVGLIAGLIADFNVFIFVEIDSKRSGDVTRRIYFRDNFRAILSNFITEYSADYTSIYGKKRLFRSIIYSIFYMMFYVICYYDGLYSMTSFLYLKHAQ